MTRLRTARTARGWSQAQLIHALSREAAADGLRLPAHESMRIMLSRWENGHVQPDETYRRYLCAVFDSEEGALGLTCSKQLMTAGAALPTPEVSATLIGHLQRTFDELARTDNQLGAAAVLAVAESEANLLTALAGETSGALRADVLALGSRYAEFCGWLRQDAGDVEVAQRWSDRALDYAQELGDPDQLSYVLMRKSNLAIEVGEPARAIGLADAALRQATLLTPQLRAVALRQRALGHAMAGESKDCMNALDAARDEVECIDIVDARAAYVSPSYIGSEAGRCLVQIGQPAKAEGILRRALQGWPAELERDRGHCLTRLSSALLDMKEVDESAGALLDAVAVAGTTSSERLRTEIRDVGRRLSRWRRIDSVGEVTNAMTALR